MVPPVVNWTLLLFLVSALTVTVNARTKFRSESRDGYMYLTIGLAIFTFVALVRLCVANSLLDSVPFLSDPLFHRVIAWIGVITGTVFIVSGLSNWLPISRAARARRLAAMARLEFIRTTEQLVQVESRPDKILQQVLDQMLRLHALSAGAVYLYSNRRNNLVLSVATPGYMRQELENLALMFDPDGWSRFKGGVRAESSGMVTGFDYDVRLPSVVMPMVVGERPSGFFFLWLTEDRALQEEDRSNLRLVVDIIARKFESDQINLKNKFLSGKEEWRNQLVSIVSYSRTVRETLPHLVADIRSHMAVDLFCLLVVDNHTHRMKRYTLGKNNTLLAETALSAPADDSFIGKSMTMPVPELHRLDRTSDGASRFGSPMFAQMRSVVVIPVKNVPGCRAVVALASRETNAYGPRKIELGEAIGDALAKMLRMEIERSHAAARERRLTRLGSFMDLSHNAGFDELCRLAVADLYAELALNVARIYVLAPDGRSLILRAVAGDAPNEIGSKSEISGDFREAMSAGEIRTVEATSDAEENVFTLVAPIRGRQQGIGLMELVRSSARFRRPFGRTDIQYTALVAHSLSSAYLNRGAYHSAGTAGVELPLRSRVKSSLSGIMGSLEMLNAHKDAERREIAHYLAIMDRSARRLSEYVEDEVLIGD